MFKYFVFLAFFVFNNNSIFAANPRRITNVQYNHSTVGTTAQDAIASVNILIRLFGWRICHDGGSVSGYLAISNGVDPAADGIRIAPNTCYLCDDCGSQGLIDANVKADAASTGYTVLQFK